MFWQDSNFLTEISWNCLVLYFHDLGIFEPLASLSLSSLQTPVLLILTTMLNLSSSGHRSSAISSLHMSFLHVLIQQLHWPHQFWKIYNWHGFWSFLQVQQFKRELKRHLILMRNGRIWGWYNRQFVGKVK